MGRQATLALFFNGYGFIMIGVLLLISALLWLLSGDTENKLFGKFTVLLGVFLLAMGILEFVYFFAFAAAFSALAGCVYICRFVFEEQRINENYIIIVEMEQNDYHSIITVNTEITLAFESIQKRIGEWWTPILEGRSEKAGDEFTVHFGDTFVVFKITDLAANSKIAWLVTDCHLSWLHDKHEWTGSNSNLGVQR